MQAHTLSIQQKCCCRVCTTQCRWATSVRAVPAYPCSLARETCGASGEHSRRRAAVHQGGEIHAYGGAIGAHRQETAGLFFCRRSERAIVVAALPFQRKDDASAKQGNFAQKPPSFQLPLAVALAGSAFEAYLEPAGAEGFQEVTQNGTTVTFTDRQAGCMGIGEGEGGGDQGTLPDVRPVCVPTGCFLRARAVCSVLAASSWLGCTPACTHNAHTPVGIATTRARAHTHTHTHTLLHTHSEFLSEMCQGILQVELLGARGLRVADVSGRHTVTHRIHAYNAFKVTCVQPSQCVRGKVHGWGRCGYRPAQLAMQCVHALRCCAYACFEWARNELMHGQDS